MERHKNNCLTFCSNKVSIETENVRCLHWSRLHLWDVLKESETLTSQQAFTCLKLTIETLEQDVKYVQSY